MLDVNGQSIGDGTLELVKFAETASAVNEITVTNSATGNAPEIASSGDDTNIDLKLTPKGTGKLNLDGIKFPNADGSSGQALTTNGSGILSFSTISADGTADWDTTVKTTGFTATANKGYFCNTTSAAFTVTLPATPSAGDEVIILDYAGTFDTNALIISPNGNKIEGATANLQLTGEREGVRLVYIDSTQGWLAYSGINEGTDALSPVPYSVDFLVIAGGGAGGNNFGFGSASGAAGGAGGYRNSFSTETSGGNGSSEASLTFNVGTVYTVTVGAGAPANTTNNARGGNGNNSSISGTGISTITSTGGGGGGGQVDNAGLSGGSGGGGCVDSSGGNGTANQGFNGGNAAGGSSGGGGGGGASAVGGNGSDPNGGNGGNGLASSITGSSVTRGGGGGGSGAGAGAGGGTKGTGGTGGGGNGAQSPSTSATAGSANTGGGGGGGNADDSISAGGAGGSGVVILRIATANYSGTTTGSPTVTTDGSDKVIVFNSSGSITG
jgi:hypothetical protein